jgi:hypothetical protein
VTDHERYTRTMRDAQADMVAALAAGREREARDAVCDDLRYAWKVASYTRSGTCRTSDAWLRRKRWAAACWIAAQVIGGGDAE